MALHTHLKRRKGGNYSARLVVPLDLQSTIGKKVLEKALGTSEPARAKRLSPPIIEGWNRDFDELRRRRNATSDDLASAVWGHYSRELDRDLEDRAARPTQAMIAAERDLSIAAIAGLPDRDNPIALINAVSDLAVLNGKTAWATERRQRRLRVLTDHLAKGETILVEDAADIFIARQRLLIEPGSQPYRDLSFRLMRAEIEALKRADERDRGDYSGMPTDPVVSRPSATAEVALPNETIGVLFERYAKENPKRITEATLQQARRDIGTFTDLVGADFSAVKIDKKAVREWKSLLQSYPVKASEIGAFKGMGFREIIKANETVSKPVIGHKTVNRYMAGFGAFCNWLAAHDYIAANPFTDMYLTVDKTSTTTKTFTPDQLKTLFSSPLFTGSRNNEKWDVAGDHRISDHRYWLPLVMMYSGARPGEIAQLLLNDLREVHGHWVMQITDEGDATKRVKTRGSVRVVPIHSELVKLGFIDFHQTMKAKGETRLFPEAERNAAGQIAAKFEAKFGKYLTKLGIKDGRGLSLYSFRHGFADAMRSADYMDAEFGFLLGHSKFSVTERYGQIPQGTLAKRVKMIEAVRYP